MLQEKGRRRRRPCFLQMLLVAEWSLDLRGTLIHIKTQYTNRHGDTSPVPYPLPQLVRHSSRASFYRPRTVTDTPVGGAGHELHERPGRRRRW